MSLGPHTHYAGFWRRTAAVLIDTVIFAMVMVGVMMILGAGLDMTEMMAGGHPPADGVLSLLINSLLPIVLTVFFWVKFLGTPGKLLLSCQVVDARSGASLSTGQALLRYLCYYVSALPLMLGFLWVLWDKRKQGFHDKIAKTVVIVEDDTGVDTAVDLAKLERDWS